MQMTNCDIYFDHKKEHQRACVYCVVAIIVTVLIIAASFNIPRIFFQTPTASVYILFIVSNLFENSFLVAVCMTYVTLLYCLYKRFVALNSVLRY